MTTETSNPASPAPDHRSGAIPIGRFRNLPVLLLGLVAYVPLLLTAPGDVSADTKAPLLLEPARALARAPYMWNSHVDAGTVTHQNIGYLFPLGPWYWMFRTLGVPTWIAERLWFGTLLFLAGAGTLWMLRRFGMRGWSPVAGAFVYMLSPYVLAYMGRTSIILTPWSMLPILIGLTIGALRERTWRAPALFALAVTFMAGTNASSVIFVLLGPAVLIPFMVWGTREIEWRAALRTLARLAVATIPAQMWWATGLLIQGRYGLPILQLTESVETVAQTSTAAEGLRGLGYWYFYGRDGLTSWTESGPLYTTTLVMLVVSFVLPVLGLIGAIVTRWKWRAYFVALLLIGVVLAVGTYPYDAPSPIGSVFKIAMAQQVGFALRNSPRVLPLVILASAAMIAALCDALATRFATRMRSTAWRRATLAVPLGVIVIALLNLPPLWTGGFVQSDMKYPETLPSYWTDAARWLDANDTGRVLEVPGADFGAYRWGETQDPLTPGIIDRDWVGRELTAYGSPASVDVLRALDAPFQEGIGDPTAVAGIARLFGASDVLLRLDSQYERYHGARPADLWTLFGAGGDGPLGAPITFGDPTVATADPRQPTIDESELARDGAVATPPLAIYSIDDARALLRAESSATSTIVWGDGRGLVAASAAGLLPNRTTPIFYAATMNADQVLRSRLLGRSPTLVVTDTNRKRAQRWGTTRENDGATETADSVALVEDPKDTRLTMLPGAASDDQSVAWFGDDVADVRATSYGNIVAYSSEVRPINAIDGDPRTAWSTGGYSDVVGDRIEVAYTHPISADHIDLLQTQGNRYITRVTVLLDGEPATIVDMTDTSFGGTGQRVELGGLRTFSELTIRIDAANVSGLQNYVGVSNVGFREITVPGVSAAEWIVTPSRGLDQFPTTPATYLFTRWRANPIEAWRQDPELQLRRIFEVTAASTSAITGRVRLSGTADSAIIDRLLGRPGLAEGAPVVDGNRYLAGVPADRPSSAVDGDPTTAWVTPFGDQIGAGFTLTNPTDFTTTSLHLTYLDDGRHSVPTRLRLTSDDGSVTEIDVPAADVSADGVATVDIAMPTIVTSSLRVEIAGERAITTKEYFGGGQHALPIAIVDLGLPVTLAPVPSSMSGECRRDLVSVDGRAVGVRLSGSTADAVAREPLSVVGCDPLDLVAGSHRLVTTKGLDTGLDVDSIELRAPTTSPASTTDVPPMTWERTGELSYRVSVDAATAPFWLVLGQSNSEGWSATVRGQGSLGPSTLIDGFANGWYVTPDASGGPMTIDITWTPQRTVWIGLIVSASWFLGLLLLAGVTTARRRRRARVDDADDPARLASLATDGRLPTMTALWTIAGLTVIGASIGGTGVAIATAAISSLAIATRRHTLVTALAATASLASIVVLYVGLQWHHRYPTGVEWPSGFWIAHQLGLTAVLSVVIELVVRFVWRRRSTSDASARDDNQINAGSALTR